MRWAWFFGGWLLGGAAMVCLAAKLYPFMWGAGIVSFFMFVESIITKDGEK